MKLIPGEFALKNTILPIKLDSNTLTVAMKNEDNALIKALRLITKYNINTVILKESTLKSLIKYFYEMIGVDRAVEDIRLSKNNLINLSKVNTDEKFMIDNAPAVKLVDHIINSAINNKASDIHIEPGDENISIRYRIDGRLINSLSIPMDVYSSIITRIKILCCMDISEKRIPQDGKCQHTYQEDTYDIRASSIPTIFGEKIVIRILNKSFYYCNLGKIFEDESQRTMIRKFMSHSHGIILMTGPTGSGKSSTLYAMLNELNKKDINITTIEDPVEYTMKGINQINVNTKAGITFAAGLRSILRQDPDVIMLGEIRDEETASIAIRAAITGHLVLSTIHTNNAYGTINRLIEMGIEKYLLADALIGIISQRLVRKICENCKEPYHPSSFERKVLKLDERMKLFKGRGCSFCHNTGYSGRTAVSEILYVDDGIKNNIMSMSVINDKERLRNSLQLIDNCKDIVLKGITTFDELCNISNGFIHDIGEINEDILLQVSQ